MNTHTPQYLTQAEFRRFLAGIKNERDRALFLLAYSYGLRASEIGLLKREDVDFERQRIRITRLKGSLSGEYLLRREVALALRRYLRTRSDDHPALFLSRLGKPISRRTLDYLMKRYGEKASIPPSKRHFHALKHSIATHFLEAGAKIMFVKDWLGHRSIKNTLIYTQMTNGKRDEQARRAFASKHIV